MTKLTTEKPSKPLLLTFASGHPHRLDREMLKRLANHFRWTETQTIHVALTRMYVSTFPELIHDKPLTKVELAQAVDLPNQDIHSLKDWAQEVKSRISVKSKKSNSVALKIGNKSSVPAKRRKAASHNASKVIAKTRSVK